MQSLKDELLELLDRNDLLQSALILGRIQDINFDSFGYQERILELAAEVWNRTAASKYDPVQKAEGISEALFGSAGLKGKGDRVKNVIDDPARFYIHSILESKNGSPLGITILYMILAEQVGLPVSCIALPSHYFLRVNSGPNQFYVDPFDSGKIISAQEFQRKLKSAMKKYDMSNTSLYETVDGEQILIRLVQQLKHVYILKGKALEALRTVEILTALYPESPELTRDRGILYCEMEYFSKAVDDLRYYLKERPEAEDVGEIKKLAKMLRGHREVIN